MNECNIYFLNENYKIKFNFGDIEIYSTGNNVDVIEKIISKVIENNKIKLDQINKFKILIYKELIKEIDDFINKEMLEETKTKLKEEKEKIKYIIKCLDNLTI